MRQLEKNLYSFYCVKCEEREQKLHEKEANKMNVCFPNSLNCSCLFSIIYRCFRKSIDWIHNVSFVIFAYSKAYISPSNPILTVPPLMVRKPHWLVIEFNSNHLYKEVT